ncbi:MAG TPA: TRAP transporter small permease [Hydrogenophaga sp.]|uniref:TRAP transporter small permease n=1 Tax=Hydrogenophaga sp. TaxID=1904254 RepID=UPI002C4C1B47|nr:TRAP transporter small permease [Hydrogenophaga sp.]HMN93236.1 TRAP transporter small permease [Hydrogenophaga sp.]HMP11470.1 TRAP transporter small permease [Hydrogenophaga sp.]
MKLSGRILKRVAELAMALCMSVMLVVIFVNVVLRYGWGTGILISEELARLLFVWLVSLSAAIAFHEGKHLGFDMVTSRLQGRPAVALWWISRGLTALVLYHLITGAWEQVLMGLNSRSPVMGYPLALTAGGIFVMGVSMALLLACQAWSALRWGALPKPEAPLHDAAQEERT